MPVGSYARREVGVNRHAVGVEKRDWNKSYGRMRTDLAVTVVTI